MKKATVIASHELPVTPLDPAMAARREEKLQVAMAGLCGCWGCTLSLLDLDEALITLLESITLVRSSLTDIKRISGRCAIGFVEGGVASDEHIETLLHFREHCDLLISVGACAIWGGVPAMRNTIGLKQCLQAVYLDSPTAVPGAEPVIPCHPEIPALTDQVRPCHEVVRMDYFIPGCPPDAAAIFRVLDDLLNGRDPALSGTLIRYD